MSAAHLDQSRRVPVVEYARVEPDEIVVRSDEASVVVLVPPPRVWQSILHALIWGTGVSLGLSAGSATISALGTSASSDATLAYAGGTALLGLAIGTIVTIVRLIQAALRSRLPALIRVSRGVIEVRSPSAFAIRSREWHTASLVDLSLREVGPMRAIFRYVHVQILLTEDRIEEMRLPWNGKGGFEFAEDSLRIALGLPRPPQVEARPA
jgi:hypothetical protein